MFDTDLDTPLSSEETNVIIESIAKWVIDRGLETPMIFFLEIHKPLSNLAGQSMLVAMPFLAPLLGAQNVADFSKILRNRENVDLLISRIEEIATEKDAVRQETRGRENYEL